MNRNVPISSARYLRVFIDPSCGPSHDATVWARSMLPGHATGRAGRADQERVAPGPAQDLDELEPVDRRRRGPLRRRPRRGARGGTPRRTAPGPSVRAAAIRAASSSLPISPNDTNGSRGMNSAVSGRIAGIGHLAGQRQAHRSRQVGVGHGADVRPRGVDGEVDREVRRSARARTGSAPRVRRRGGRAGRRRGRRAPARPCGGRSA